MGQCCGVRRSRSGDDDDDNNNENASFSPLFSSPELSRRWSFSDPIPPPPPVGFAATPSRLSAVNCHEEMDSQEVFSAASLTDDLVVEILSRVPLKSFCRFKCVCKAWLAFSSNQHYKKKLPKFSTGFFNGGKGGSAIQLVSLSPNDEQIDGALTFLPHYKHLEFMDSCNGLVLCKYRSTYTSSDICRFVVCNPATREWMTLPDTYHETYLYEFQYITILAFDPSWSPQFYVLFFKKKFGVGGRFGISKLLVFDSGSSRWLVDKGWNSRIALPMDKQYFFMGGKLHLKTVNDEILVLEGFEAMSFGIPPHYFTIELPHDVWCFEDGCFGQSRGFLQCAFPENGGLAIAVYSLDTYHPDGWSLKHRLNMQDAFGRDDFLHCDDGNLQWPCNYHIVYLDLERGVIFLVNSATKKLLSYNIKTGKRSEIHDDYDCHYFGARYANQYYVASYSKLPG